MKRDLRKKKEETKRRQNVQTYKFVQNNIKELMCALVCINFLYLFKGIAATIQDEKKKKW